MARILVGMSGGVDSSVAAYLLKEKGYEVVGATLEMFCEGMDDNKDAAGVSKMLEIQHHFVDLKDAFENTVVKYFVDEYVNGVTPNPCVFCNRNMKFPGMMNFAKKLGCDYISTGHYARIEEQNGRFCLKKAADENKDQTYMLCLLSQQQLSKLVLPLGELTKPEIRELARKTGISVAEKKDSQDICFVKDGDYMSLVCDRSEFAGKKGNFCDTMGNILGIHKGIEAYTIGQRKGLGISSDAPLYVISKQKETNNIILGRENELYSTRVYVENVNYVSIEKIAEPMRVKAKLRYAHKESDCTAIPTENGLVLEFDAPQRAVTPGQFAVLYDADMVLCGGVIV